ncbi:MAG: hypothetical protein QXO98_02095 [Sulfolobales archaeon]
MGVISLKYSYEELRRVIEEKVKELRKELEVYESILKVLERFSKTPEKVNDKKFKEEVITLKDSEDNIVATITVTPNKVKVVPLIKIDSEHRLVKSYLVKFLEEKKTSSIGRVSRYEIKDADGYVSEIIIEGNFNEYFTVELEAALMYIINSIPKESSD